MHIRYPALLFMTLLVGSLTAGCTSPGNTHTTPIPVSTPEVAHLALPAGVTPFSAAVSPVGGQPVTIELSAGKMAFSLSSITVPAASDVIVNFHNQEPAGSSQVTGIAHNFALYDSPAAKTTIFSGEITTGGENVSYTFAAPGQPGTYFFRDDLYPLLMNGTFVVT
jgi:plastocyanin